jgi:predicted ATPase
MRVAVTGGPGAGKTTLIQGLEQRGFTVVPEAAREIIAERKSRGQSPRPDPLEFARAIVARDIERYEAVRPNPGLVFFDRSLVDALGMLAELGELTDTDRHALLERHPYHPSAFILPPWRDIYRTDSERDQTWEQAVAVFESLQRWYTRCGLQLVEVPPGTIAERCDFVLQRLAERGTPG